MHGRSPQDHTFVDLRHSYNAGTEYVGFSRTRNGRGVYRVSPRTFSALLVHLERRRLYRGSGGEGAGGGGAWAGSPR